MKSFPSLSLLSSLCVLIVLPGLAKASGGGGGNPIVCGIGPMQYPTVSQSGNGTSYETTNTSAYVQAQSGASLSDSSITLNLTWVAGFTYTQNPAYITVSFTVTDSTFVSWSLGGYSPPDPKGQVSSTATVGTANYGFSISQTASNNSGSSQSPSPLNPVTTTFHISPTWYGSLGNYFTDATYTMSSMTATATANYTTPTHYSSSDLANAFAEENVGISATSG